MKTQFCTALGNSIDAADLASKQLKALIERLDDETKAILSIGELDAYIAKLRYHVEHLDERMFTKGG